MSENGSGETRGPEMAAGGLRPSDVDFMPPLLRSLSSLCRLRGKALSPQFLLAGLSGSTVSAQACLRVARKAGLTGSVLYRPRLAELSNLTLPCILLLSGNRSCVLTRLVPGAPAGSEAGETGAETAQAEVIFPETESASQLVPLDALQEEYTGYALYVAVPGRPQEHVEKLRLAKGKRWFWDVLRYYAPIYRHVALASVIINLIALASPLFAMNVYDRVVPNNAIETLWVLASGVIIIYLFDFLLRALRTHFVDVAGRNADIVLSSNLVDKVLTMRLESKPESTGSLVNNLREFFSSSSLLACIDVPFLVIFLLLIAFIAGPMVFLPLAAMPILIGLGLFLQTAARRCAEQSYKQNMQKNALLVEMVNGLETIKACQAESRMQRLWEAVVGLSAKSTAESRRYSSLAVTASTLVTHMVTVSMIIWGVYRISEGLMTMGALIGCNILVGRAMAPLMQLASLLTRLQNSRVALQALDLLMELPSENQSESSCMDFGELQPSFTVENVSFAYPNSMRLALEDVSLRINPGDRIGIIGAMGSGKSTLAKLLTGFYQPQKGSIKFGDVDLRQLPTTELRGRIGVLPQDVVLFYGSIRENIVLGDPTINDHLVFRAAALAGVTDFVRNNPAGFAAQVGEQGKALSGGQRQAVALARALVRDPEVLILDEPTNGLDIEATVEMREVILRLAKEKGVTFLVASHLAAEIEKMCDKVLVLYEGEMLSFDTKEEALRLNPSLEDYFLAKVRDKKGSVVL